MSRMLQSLLVGMQMAFVEMRSHMLRSSLSMLGVMLGVASLVAMLTLIGGIDVFLHKRMAKWAGSVWFWEKEQADDEEKIAWSRSPGLRLVDGIQLEQQVEQVEHYYRLIERWGSIYVLDKREQASIRGMDMQTMEDELEQVEVRRGRTLCAQDFDRALPVCLVSWQLHERIARQKGMPQPDSGMLVDSEVRYKNTRLKIIGVFWPKDEDAQPRHLRRAIVMPLRAMQSCITGFNPDPGSLRIGVDNPEIIEQQTKHIARQLAQLHRGVEDFEFRTADWLEDISRMLSNATVLMSIVSVISLLVGGMSIMNVMLSSISERIHEIGVRKALGAKNLQIFIQFIAEAVTLCFIGGCVGAFLGLIPIAFGDAIKRSTDGAIDPTILPGHVVFVVVIIATIGIIFGMYPALKAVRMDPVEALRYE